MTAYTPEQIARAEGIARKFHPTAFDAAYSAALAAIADTTERAASYTSTWSYDSNPDDIADALRNGEHLK